MRALTILTTIVLAIGGFAVSTGALSDETMGQDDTGRCGVSLVLRNPDLQEDRNGFIRAGGWLFIQFQAVGPGAENVKYFTFSFGKPMPGDYSNCQTPEWVTGAYLKNYRGDYNPENGFFVPINTTLVPDDVYGAAVHAYNANDQEIGRFWVKARVKNCDGPTGSRCGDDPAQVARNERVAPWPIILPGDGKQTNPVDGVTIEFAEGLESAEAWINGEPIELEPWGGRAWDDDAVPGNDDPGGPTYATCTVQGHPACNKRIWGPAFKWEGEIGEEDVIRVRAVDRGGNVAEKIVHLLDPTAGGIVLGDEVRIDVQVDEAVKRTSPRVPQDFTFTFTNVGTAEAHVDLLTETEHPDKVRGTFRPVHVVVPPGDRREATLTVTPNPSVQDGTLYVTATAEWRSEGRPLSRHTTVTLIVGEGGEIAPSDANATEDHATDLDHGGSSAGLAPLLVLAGALAALAVVQRRGRSS